MGFLKGLIRKATGGGEVSRRRETLVDEREAMPDAELSESDCRYRETAHHGSLPAPCAIAVDPIQGLVAVGNKSGVVKVIGREGVERLLRAEIAAPVSCLAFAPGLGIVCAGTDAPAIYIWDLTVEGGKRNWRCIPLRAFPTCLHCPSGAPFLYAGTSEGDLLFAHLPSGDLAAYAVSPAELGCNAPAARSVVSCEALSSSSLLLLVALREGLITLWDMEKRRSKPLLGGGIGLAAARPSPDARLAAAGYTSGEVLVWLLAQERAPILRLSPGIACCVRALSWGAMLDPGADKGKEKGAGVSGVSLVILEAADAYAPGRLVVLYTLCPL
ncbi:hypothetical protein T484DRAFT_1772065 [Baffinella frigidus]|nr:hypothetical protein T484DRAFT_1772065 [Cryptophyta sp. CCMP2293]